MSGFGFPARTKPINRSFRDVQLVDCLLQRVACFLYCLSRRLSGAVRCYEVVLEGHLTADHVQIAAASCFEGVARLTNTDIQRPCTETSWISDVTILAFLCALAVPLDEPGTDAQAIELEYLAPSVDATNRQAQHSLTPSESNEAPSL